MRYKNIFLIVIDSGRADFLYPFNSEVIFTPSIKKISQEGVVFKKCFSTDIHTIPTHTSFFSGYNPLEHGVNVDTPKIPDNLRNIVNILKNKGFTTYAYTANPLLIPTGILNSFDYVFSSMDKYINWFDFFKIKEKNKLKKLLKFPLFLYKNKNQNLVRSMLLLYEIKMKNDLSMVFGEAKEVVDFIKVQKLKEPFFFFINLMDTHYPYGTKESRNHKLNKLVKDLKKRWEVILGYRKISDEEKIKLRELYRKSIEYLDTYIGYIYENYKKNSLFIITSDHGECLGENNYLAHEPVDLPLPLVNIPLIVAPLKKRLTVDKAVSQTIIYDILCEYAAHGEIEFNFSKIAKKEIIIFTYFYDELFKSLRKIFKNRDKILNRLDRFEGLKIYSMIKENIRYVRYEFKDGEKESLREIYGDPIKEREIKDRNLLKEMRKELNKYIHSLKKFDRKEEDKEDVLKHLKGLGYI